MDALIILTDIVEKLILLTLFGLSIWSISIIIDRKRLFKKEMDKGYFIELKEHLERNQLSDFQNKLSSKNNFISGALNSAVKNSQSIESIDRSHASFVKYERQRIEMGLSILGTLGSNAPFIGLFGTVLGIIRSFAYLGSQSGSGAVMSGVSQALYATALGLFVAIPSVVFFNIFTKQTKDLLGWSESLRDLYIAKKKQ